MCKHSNEYIFHMKFCTMNIWKKNKKFKKPKLFYLKIYTPYNSLSILNTSKLHTRTLYCPKLDTVQERTASRPTATVTLPIGSAKSGAELLLTLVTETLGLAHTIPGKNV